VPSTAAFLKTAGLPAAAAALPLDLSEALAIPVNNRPGTIADVTTFATATARRHYSASSDDFAGALPPGGPSGFHTLRQRRHPLNWKIGVLAFLSFGSRGTSQVSRLVGRCQLRSIEMLVNL
jgi:hypothetical protein